MENNNRRKFLRELGLTVGALAVGKEMMFGFPPFQKQIKPFTRERPTPKAPPVDYRYAPESWQSTFCFPNDPFKSLVSKHGELLYGYATSPDAPAGFAQVVSFGLRDREPGTYVLQKKDDAGVPVVTTVLGWKDVKAELTLFATQSASEGRVDNLLVKITPLTPDKTAFVPELRIKSHADFSGDSKDDSSVPGKEIGIGTLKGKTPRVYFVADAPVDHSEHDGVHHFRLKKEELAQGASASYFFRFPQEAQSAEKITPGLVLSASLLAEARSFWQSWKPTGALQGWTLAGTNRDFLIGSSLIMGQCRESRAGKGSYLSGPSVSRSLGAVEGHFMTEAALYLGNTAEAHETLVALWDRQDDKGAIVGQGPDQHSKETAAAIYSLVRSTELSQNWDYFNELYPDAYKAAMHLKSLRDLAAGDGTPNGNYGLIQKGVGESGLPGVRSELTNTLWTLTALKLLLEVSDRLTLDKRSDVREFYGQLRAAFIAASKQEVRKHPNGFSYLPMLLKGDDLWSTKDAKLMPQPQASQIFFSQAIYPGLLFTKEDNLVKSHIDLMKASIKEEVPAESGVLSHGGVWNADAAAAAQVFLWAGMREEARAMFDGFLNHASPLHAWRQEQPLLASGLTEYFGDMPQAWASAECIRFLRHTLVLEDDKDLRLLDGLADADMTAAKPLALASTPTRWGRVSVSLEPVEAKIWKAKFTREPADELNMPKLASVVLPLRLPGNYQFDTFTGPKVIKNAPSAIIDPSLLSFEVTYKNFRRT